jgi:hypothetical protein
VQMDKVQLRKCAHETQNRNRLKKCIFPGLTV